MQVYLAIEYDTLSEFQNETERLSTISYDATELFETEQLVVATHILEDDTYEYAFINSEEQTILYFFIQNLPKEEIEFDHAFLPNEYYRYSEYIENSSSC